MLSKLSHDECKLHNIQYYNLLPRGINCLSVNVKSGKLALSRDDGTIEIWNLLGAPFMEKSIPGYDKVSIEAINWIGDRLFSVGLAGSLVEWDLQRLKVKNALLLTGNAGWCMAANRQHKDKHILAVGTEGGYINIYNTENNSIWYEKILDKQEGRVICMKFDHTGEFLVTGSVDTVRIWNIEKGHVVHKMNTGRSANKETIVWDLLVLKDFTIISGDSRGKIMFFDGHLGTTIDSSQASKADILCLAIEKDEKYLYCGGVEPIIKRYQKVEIEKCDEKVKSYVRTLNRRMHTHDVKCLGRYRNQLISAGVEGTLIICSFPPLTVDKYYPFLETPATVLASASRMILLKYVNYLEVWTLNRTPVQSRKILQVRSKKDEHIVAAAISPNGKWIIYSTEGSTRLYRFDYSSEGQSRLVPIRAVPEQFEPCTGILFTSDSSGVFLFKLPSTIEYFIFTDEDDFAHKQTIEAEKWLGDKIHLSSISNDDKFLACAALCGSIVIFKRDTSGRWSYLVKLPKYTFVPTAIAIQPGQTILAAVFSDHKIYQYDFNELKFTFASFLKLDRMGVSENKTINNIIFDPRKQDAMILQHDSNLMVLLFEDEQAEGEKPKRRHSGYQKEGQEAFIQRYSLSIVKGYTYLVSSCWLGKDELVAVEANPVSMVEYLPPAFRRKRFGTT